MPNHLISPYGGTLCDLFTSETQRSELKAASREWPSWDLTPEQLCELELLATGAYSPLRGFMVRADADSVASEMRLADGTFWPLPVTLSLPGALAQRLQTGGMLALRDSEGLLLAGLSVEEIWRSDEASDLWCVGGAVTALQLPPHHDFTALRLSPADLRREFVRQGWRRVVAYQTARPIHRAEHAATLAVAKAREARVLVHVEAGKGSSADADHFTCVRCCQAAIARYPKDTARLALLPSAWQAKGQRELLLRALVARNYGCTHLLIDAQEGSHLDPVLPAHVAAAIGTQVVVSEPMAYLEEEGAFVGRAAVPAGVRGLHLSEDELRARLAEGREIPAWFSYPEVLEELRRAHPPRHRQGLTVFFTGLSGAGKSTIASVLMTKLLEMGGRPVTLLDGDIVRKHLSSELGFSKEHRDINIRRIGFVASEITKNGGIAICAPIAPYDATRKLVRCLVERVGGFVLVHVSTPLATCELRDRKGLYAKARAGLVPHFTGVSDPYEEPADAELVLDTSDVSPEEAAQEVLLNLEKAGFISAG